MCVVCVVLVKMLIYCEFWQVIGKLLVKTLFTYGFHFRFSVCFGIV